MHQTLSISTAADAPAWQGKGVTDYAIVRDINWRGASRLERDKKNKCEMKWGRLLGRSARSPRVSGYGARLVRSVLGAPGAPTGQWVSPTLCGNPRLGDPCPRAERLDLIETS